MTLVDTSVWIELLNGSLGSRTGSAESRFSETLRLLVGQAT
jgi:predicted nucleic acid-binding protein